jgi:Tol biopolymer transport system component
MLTVGRSGTGSGTVTSDPPGIDCGADCQEDFTYGTVVTLTAQAAAGSTFNGWIGDCIGVGQCVLFIDDAKSAIAAFTLNGYLLTVGRSGTGSGTVTSLPPGIDCGADCQETFTYGTVVTLTAQAAAGSAFAGWSGDCTGTGQCAATMDQTRLATATFNVLTGTTERVSLASDGSQGYAHSWDPSISADGRYVAFDSGATNLVDGDTNGTSDVFVRDRATRQTTRLSLASDGTQGNNSSEYPSISADGRYVAFESGASNLVSGDTNGYWDIFVHDQTTGQTTLASVASDGTQGNGNSADPSISADGRYVAFRSIATNLVSGDTNGSQDIFVHDLTTGQTQRVSVASDGTQGDTDSYEPSLSADGRYVAFNSYASNLVSGDTNYRADVFIHDRTTGQTTRLSLASSGTQGDDDSFWPFLSADGRYVAFESYASNLVEGDSNEFCYTGVPEQPYINCPDIFVHDLMTGQTTRVSVASDGTQGNNYSNGPSISADGRYVAFSSLASTLVSRDTNGWDVFVHDRTTGQTTRVSLASDGTQGNGNSAEEYNRPSISADGCYVAFQSYASNLVSGDTNGASDIFVHTLQGNLLAVGRSGTGSGTVTSDPPGIDCGLDCQEDFTYGTVVNLTAQAAASSTFAGWSGDCTGTGQCVANMDQTRSVTATFTLNDYLLIVGRSGTGSGTVSSLPPGIDCGADCQETFRYGTVVTLTAQAAAGSTFTGWISDCTGPGQCVLTIDDAKSAIADFTLNEYPLSVGKSGTGSGTVTSDPPGIDCGADCQEDFTYGTVVTLTAQAAVNSAFTGWSGDCSGTGACVLTITQPYSVTADFKGDYKLYLPIIRNTAGAANLPIESSPVALLYAAPLTTTSPNLLQDAFAWLRLLLSLMDSVV